MLDYFEINTQKTPDCSIIWLHGLGADGHDFKHIVSELALPLGIRFIFPHAPIQPVSINGGYPMRAWFDILGLNEAAKQDEVGIKRSQLAIGHFIDKVIASGIPSHRIIIGGFSQGGALALYVALHCPQKLAGVIGLSTFLPLANRLASERQLINAALPIFLAHGKEDTVVPYSFATSAYNRLKALNYPVSLHNYAMLHTVSAEEVKDISQWIQRILSD
jgi:phospholipase/carboxylesterase